TEALAPVSLTASATVLNTGRPRCSLPPLPGVTPPTTLVPYSSICSAWKVPCWPVKPCTITLVFLLTNTLIAIGSLEVGSGGLGRGDGLAGAVVDVVGGGDRQAGVLQQLLAGVHVGPLQAHDHRHLDVHFLDRGDDALGDHVAAHDAAEDIDEDRLHVVARQDQLERLGHALDRKSTRLNSSHVKISYAVF